MKNLGRRGSRGPGRLECSSCALERMGQGTHSVGNAVGESHKLDLVLGALPVGEEGQDEAKGGCLRFGGAVGEGDVAEGGRDAVLRVVGAHVWEAMGS